MTGILSARFVWIRTSIIILGSIAPLCVTYTVLAIHLPLSHRPSKSLECWVFAEAVFFFLTFLYQRYLQRPSSHPPPPSKVERQKLFSLCYGSTGDHGKYLTKWFLGAPLDAIKRENVKEWLRWAFLNTAVADPAHVDEVEGYVKSLEIGTGAIFEPGRADVKCLRLTLDKVNALHRSLIWYLCIFVVDIVTHTRLLFHDFRFYRSSLVHSVSIFPPRPYAYITSHRSPAPSLTYWYRPHTSHNELPILFIHGIGVGLYPYIELFKGLNQRRRDNDGKVGILAIEILPISSRVTAPLLRKEDMCQQIRLILQRHKFNKFVLVSHSYGSVITTHLLKTPDLASKVSSLILVDPVTILLHQPDVAYNFTVRRPNSANEWLLWYFGSKDMGVAHTLSRMFFWSENILWKEDLCGRRAIVYLGGKDSIINTRQVRAYLQETEENGLRRDDSRSEARIAREILPPGQADGKLDVVWCADLDHGQIFNLPIWRARLEKDILAQARVGADYR